MRSSISVTAERAIGVPPEAMWALIADPEMHPRVDPRVRVLSASGEPGSVSSGYELEVRPGAGMRFRMQYVVVEAHVPLRLAADVTRGRKKLAEQRAEIFPHPGGSLLRWTVVMWPGLLTRRAAKASCERELAMWMASVEREALNSFWSASSEADEAY